VPQALRFLCTGDLHLGRYPTRVPAGERELSVDHVWSAIVDHAIAGSVDALLLTGDVADHANAFYEAFGALKRGVERLIEQGIPTVAVAGNHDFDVLGRLADTLDTPLFRVIGRGGVWETLPIERAGLPVLRLTGWSFPTRHHTSSPLADFPTPEPGPPTIGLLHADLDVPDSLYAPVTLGELFARPVAAWILGHQHGPRHLASGGRHVLYPGSPQPLRPPETGARGPWALTVREDGELLAEPVHLATVRYAPLAVDVSAAAAPDAVQRLVDARIVDALAELAREQPTLRQVAFRVSLEGRTRHHRDMPALAAGIEERLEIPQGDVAATVEHVLVRTLPHHDLSATARRNDPAGAVAQLLLDLEGRPGDHPLVRSAQLAAESLLQRNAYLALRGEDAPDTSTAAVGARLRDQGLLLLDSLLAQTDRAA
jgi:DNA repair protein SbcD/Mre11